MKNALTVNGLPVCLYSKEIPAGGTIIRIEGFLKILSAVYHRPVCRVDGNGEITGIQLGSQWLSPWRRE